MTVTGEPSNGGTEAERNALAMQLPTTVPWKGGPVTFDEVTRPEGAKVMLTVAPPEGPSACLHPAARPAAAASAEIAADLLNSAATGGGGGGATTGATTTGAATTGAAPAPAGEGAAVARGVDVTGVAATGSFSRFVGAPGSCAATVGSGLATGGVVAIGSAGFAVSTATTGVAVSAVVTVVEELAILRKTNTSTTPTITIAAAHPARAPSGDASGAASVRWRA